MAVRVALIADTHLPRGRRRLPAQCVELISQAEVVIHAGDFTTEQVWAEIASLGPPLHAVHGNVDEPALRAQLPERVEIEIESIRIGIVHDAGPRSSRGERLRAWFPAADCVVFGHSHLPEHDYERDLVLFNPGSPTERRRAPTHSMGIAELEYGEARFRHIPL
jgi:putative phosphoesterase